MRSLATRVLRLVLLGGIALVSMPSGAAGEDGSEARPSGRELSREWVSGGPYGGAVSSLVRSPLNPNVLYAGTDSGVFVTGDGAGTWTRTPFPEMEVLALVVDPVEAQTLYAGTEDGVFKSVDGGDTWTARGLAGERVNALAMEPGTGGAIYAGTGIRFTQKGGIYKSPDGGESWELKYRGAEDRGNPTPEEILALQVDPKDSRYVYAAAIGGYEAFLRSPDGGETWELEHLGPSNWDHATSLLAVPAVQTSGSMRGEDAGGGAGSTGAPAPVLLYAVAQGDVEPDPVPGVLPRNEREIYKSVDRGESWTALGLAGEAYLGYNTDEDPGPPLVADPLDPGVLFVGSYDPRGTVYRSVDEFASWDFVADGLVSRCPSALLLHAGPERAPVLHAGFKAGNGVYRGVGQPPQWEEANAGLLATTVEDLAVHPEASQRVLAAIRGPGVSLFRTDDAGGAWASLAPSPTSLRAVAFDPGTPETLYVATSSRLYRGTGGGQSWELVATFPYVSRSSIADLWVSPADAGTLLVALDASPEAGGVYRSDDGGETWSHPLRLRITTLAADPGDPDVLYAGSRSCGHVFRSEDGGGSWTNLTPVDPGDDCWAGAVRDIELDGSSRVYVATDEGLRRWEASRSDWTQLGRLPTEDLTALAIDRSTVSGGLYVGTAEDGVYVSTDAGTSWLPFSEGLGSLRIAKLALGRSVPGILYAGTETCGVWSTGLGPRVRALPGGVLLVAFCLAFTALAKSLPRRG